MTDHTKGKYCGECKEWLVHSKMFKDGLCGCLCHKAPETFEAGYVPDSVMEQAKKFNFENAGVKTGPYPSPQETWEIEVAKIFDENKSIPRPGVAIKVVNYMREVIASKQAEWREKIWEQAKVDTYVAGGGFPKEFGGDEYAVIKKSWL